MTNESYLRRIWNYYFGGKRRKPKVIEYVPDVADGSEKVLSVKGIDFCIATNGENHHTSKFEAMGRETDPCLVVRRGQSFKIDIKFNRPFASEKDAISFIFTVADTDKPHYGQGTLAAAPLLGRGSELPRTWNAVFESQVDSHVMVNITAPADCVVAKWKIEIDTKVQGGGSLSYAHPLNIYILFNPWCKNDTVFMEGESRREEYVLADTGLIWRGSYNRLRPTIWKYAQFERDILDCCLLLIHEVGKVKGSSRGDPVRVSRAISAAVNSPDDYGAVMGNWSDDHSGGTPPTKWVGSMEILQQYWKKRKPVKYGQCWVFSGVLATICRSVGLPCRVVTCYSAAHDTQSSLTVDYFVDEKGAVMEELNSDSIWNYHVWNEVWMERPDLDSVYRGAGWQAVDATPQELSDDVFRCGPAAVRAVREGDVLKPYDNNFLFAEVNADKVFWRYAGPTQPLKLIRKDVLSIGQAISTKAIGKWEREDITSLYKYPEKSVEERAAMLRALRTSESLFSRYYLNEDFNDVQFDFALRDDIKIGSDFSVIVIVKNRSMTKDHRVTGYLRVDTVLYTGKVSESVKQHQFDLTIKPATKEEIKMEVTFNEYYKRLLDQCAFNIACLATVVDTDFEYFAQDDFRVRKPDVKIYIEGTPTTGLAFQATVKLENPLPIPLKKCQFMIEGAGLEKQMKIDLKENVAPGAVASTIVSVIPPWSGRHTLAVKFVSKELDDVDGFLAFIVQPKPQLNGDNNTETNEVV